MGYSCRTFHKEPARECGVDGVMVSNHGGRQLDHTVSPLRIAAEAKSMTVILDGGVQRALTLPKDEVDRDMALLGVRSITEVTPDLLRRLGPEPPFGRNTP